LKLLGGDLMAIPGLYGFLQVCINCSPLGDCHFNDFFVTMNLNQMSLQELTKEKVAGLYLWPKTLEVAILDDCKL
jgi:Ca2+-dependent lipid-binding protein